VYVPPYENLWTVVVAGGSGQRFGAAKQFALLRNSERVIDLAIAMARSISTGVVVVVPATDPAAVTADHLAPVPLIVVPGGATRADSVRAGLAAVPDSAQVICVHDGARPFADVDLYCRVVDAVSDPTVAAAVPGVAVTDTIKQVRREPQGLRVVATLSRDSLVAVQTPQAFRAEVLREAHRRVGGDVSLTDDAMMVESLGHVVAVVDGDPTNRKITHPEDLEWARERIGQVER
jgi:2-C-methyl-D-erythritol 4-phosphate cytidylyltransferase